MIKLFQIAKWTRKKARKSQKSFFHYETFNMSHNLDNQIVSNCKMDKKTGQKKSKKVSFTMKHSICVRVQIVQNFQITKKTRKS